MKTAIFSLDSVMPVIESSEQNKKKNNQKDLDIKNGYVIFSQFILEVLIFIGGAIALGLYLDKLCKTKCLFLIILLFLFAFVPIYNLVKRMSIVMKEKPEEKKDEKI